MTKKVKLIGRPKEYDGEMQKKNLRLPKHIWEWLDNLSTNRTKALIQLYNERKNLNITQQQARSE
jgi:hypothetical protein